MCHAPSRRVKAPHQLRSAADDEDDVLIERRDDAVLVDFGPGVEAAVDTVGETVIVVAGDDQYEFARPPEAGRITANGGMLFIEA